MGRGAGSAQSFVDTTGVRRAIIWDGFQNGATSQEIIDDLVLVANSHLHQHGIGESTHATSGTHTGTPHDRYRLYSPSAGVAPAASEITLICPGNENGR